MTIKKEYKKVYPLLVILAVAILFAQGAFAAVTYSTSFYVGDGGPLRIATDRGGNIYTTTQSLSSAKVWLLSKDGSLTGYINDFERPVGIAVDRSGRVYAGDYKKGSVGVYSPAGKFLYYLGKGEGEFGHPNDIAIDRRGYVYVTDSTNNCVKVYSGDGQFQFSFGSYGSADGQMIFPTGITIDDFAQEVYVVDHLNIRIEVFDLNGNFKRKFTSSYILRPQGIAVSNGKVYVVDAYHSSVKVFDTNGGYITSIGIYGSGPGEFIIPLDVTISNNRLLVTNSGNLRIEVFNLNEPNLVVSPVELSFTTYENSSPSSQTIQLNADAAGTLQWTAVVDAPFPVTISASSGITPSDVTVSIDTTGMAIGTYTGKLFFYANGTEYPVDIRLTIKEIPKLVVSPSSIVMHYQKGGVLPVSTLNINTTSDSVSWSGQTDTSWLLLSSTSGTTPTTITISLDSSVSAFASGTYNASIMISAPDALGSPVTVPVTLQVITGGMITVKTNLEEATFKITGPQNYSGSGTSWTATEVPPGSYEITFGDVPGYKTPSARTFTVTAGSTANIDVTYELERLANTIIAGKGASATNDGTLRLFDLNGNLLSEIKALTTTYGANVAASDLNGDGSDEIIVAPGPSQKNRAVISILGSNGSVLATKTINNTAYGARVVAGDIDGDGIPDIVVSTITQVKTKRYNTVEIYSYSNGTINKKTGIYASASRNSAPLAVAAGDINGDGKAEVIIFDSGYLKVFGLNNNLTAYLIASKAVTYNDGGRQVPIKDASLSAGDIDQDGKAEIILGYSNSAGDSMIRFYKADLTEYGREFKAFTAGKSAPSLNAMDSDGDGIVEILAGKGPVQGNDATLRLFDANGTLIKEINAFGTPYGANGALGFIKR